jgi:UDP-GlcNAc3NAcA epimerase
MSDVFFEELGIPRPRFHLGINGGLHGAMTGAMLAAIEKVLVAERPDWVLVYGDTNSTLAGALAAAKLHIPVAHVEAGLRSFNRRMPEEVNRVLTDHAADLLFAPTAHAVANLRHEGIDEARVRQVGDVMLDAARFYAARVRGEAELLSGLGVEAGGYLLATLHRAENTDDPARLRAVVECLNDASGVLPVVLPLHPRTRQAIGRSETAVVLAPGVHVIDPVGYLDMVALERNARVIATDSGGVQKEAYFHRVPCVTLRDETEWVELVEAGWNRVVGASRERFLTGLEAALGGPTPEWSAALYGDGDAAGAIARAIASAS